MSTDATEARASDKAVRKQTSGSKAPRGSVRKDATGDPEPVAPALPEPAPCAPPSPAAVLPPILDVPAASSDQVPVAVALEAYAVRRQEGRKPNLPPGDRSDYLQRFAPMVRRIAHHMLAKLPASVQLEDLVQAGLIGLMDAINRFEEGQGAQFETYAMQRIRGAMLDELRSNDWLPRGLRKTQRTIESAIHRLEQKYGRSPSETEIAVEMGIPLQEYQGLLQDARGTQLVYLDDHDEDGEGDHFLDRHLPDSSGDPGERFNDRRFREALVAAIESLPEREKTIMGLYYEQELNFREIAAVLGVTESRICQIHTQIMARLRVKMRDW